MPISHAMWTHGHSLHVEYPDRMNGIIRRGGYVRLDGKTNKSNWFHLAIPTTVLFEDSRLRIDSVMLRIRMDGAAVTHVHVYDGESKIASYDGIVFSPTDWSLERFDVKDAPRVRWGIGISFRGEFGPLSPRRIEVSAAGGDFLP